jgi:hypothetical protein
MKLSMLSTKQEAENNAKAYIISSSMHFEQIEQVIQIARN